MDIGGIEKIEQNKEISLNIDVLPK